MEVILELKQAIIPKWIAYGKSNLSNEQVKQELDLCLLKQISYDLEDSNWECGGQLY